MIELTDLDTGRKLSINPTHIVMIETRKLDKVTKKGFWFFKWYKLEIDAVEDRCVVWLNATIWNCHRKAPLSVTYRIVETEEEVKDKIKAWVSDLRQEQVSKENT